MFKIREVSPSAYEQPVVEKDLSVFITHGGIKVKIQQKQIIHKIKKEKKTTVQGSF